MMWGNGTFDKIQGLGIVFVVLIVVAFVLLLTTGFTTVNDWCAPGVSYMQNAENPKLFDAYIGGRVAQSGLTFQQVKACGK